MIYNYWNMETAESEAQKLFLVAKKVKNTIYVCVFFSTYMVFPRGRGHSFSYNI